MVKRITVVLCSVAVAAMCHLWQPAFVPPAGCNRIVPAAAGAVAAMGVAAPAFADEIGTAAKKLSEASYPFLKEVDWNSLVYLQKPGTASAFQWLAAVDKAILMGASMDPALLRAGVEAHHKAIGSIGKEGVTSKADYEAINAALGRMIASVPEDQVMDVYNAFERVVPRDVPDYLMSTVKEADAKAAYAALMEFKDVVKAHPIPAGSVASKAGATPAAGGESGAIFSKLIPLAAQKLSDAAYPFMKSVDWNSDLFLTPLPGVQAPQVLKAVDKALVMGTAMDGGALQAAALAHHNAIVNGVDGRGTLSAKDFTAINAALGKLIATVPSSKVMDVYNAFAAITSPLVPNTLFASVNPLEAQAAAAAFYEFKDVIKAAQR